MSELSKHTKTTIQAARISFILSILILLIKFFAYELTRSSAVLSDAVESIVNVIAAFVALFILKEVAAPADKEHPYGHGKMEYFSSAFEGGLIAFAAVAIAAQSISALIEGRTLTQLDLGLAVIGAAAVFNLFLGLYLRAVGNKFHSDALKASSAHVLSDVWTTVAVMAGLGIVTLTQIHWIDPLIGLLVAGQLGYSGVGIVRKAMESLLDQQDPKILKDLVKSLNDNKKNWVIDIHQLKMIRSGRFHHIDAHLVVPEYLNIAQVHEDCEDFERAVVSSYPFDGEIAFHLDPCHQKYCHRCEMKECVIRKSEFYQKVVFTTESCTGSPDL